MSQTVKVGIFATASLLVLAYFILRIEDIRLFRSAGQTVDVMFDSVAGLDEKSAVRVAGVRVGRVEHISLAGSRARVSLLLDTPVDLLQGATATISSLGLLGDKYVELDPGPAGAPPLPAGTALEGVTPLSFDDAMAKLNDVASSIQQVTTSVTGGGGETSISRLLDNLESTSEVIRELVAANRQQVSATVDNFASLSRSLAEQLPRLSDQLAALLDQVRDVVAENRGALKGSFSNVEELTTQLATSVDNLSEISGRIARGEGTIGKLVSSDEAHDELVSTLESVKGGVNKLTDVLTRVQKMQLELGMEGYYLEDLRDTRSAFRLELDPPSDKFYRLELVSDPRGRTRTKNQTITVTNPDGTTDTTRIDNVTVEDKITVSAQFGFDLAGGRLRGGLFESTAGGGVDYTLLDRRLLLSLDAFDFGRMEGSERLDPRLRFTGAWNLSPSIYLLGGVDDLLLSDRRSLFLGAGVRWRDDDLKYLLGSLPKGGL